MLPQVILMAVAGLLAAISKLITAADDRVKQEEALLEADEALKMALDHFKFGGTPDAPPTVPEPGE